MNSLYKILAANENWQANIASNRNKIEPEIRPFMLDDGSLTKQLMNLSDGHFEVSVVDETIALPYSHEQEKLKIDADQSAMIRQVELKIFDEVVVFARSIIPMSLINAKKNSLANLGQKPLGHLLFKDGNMDISKRDFNNLIIDNKQYFARRTPYQYQQTNILVSEFFLPSLRKYC